MKIENMKKEKNLNFCLFRV